MSKNKYSPQNKQTYTYKKEDNYTEHWGFLSIHSLQLKAISGQIPYKELLDSKDKQWQVDRPPQGEGETLGFVRVWVLLRMNHQGAFLILLTPGPIAKHNKIVPTRIRLPAKLLYVACTICDWYPAHFC